MNYYVTEDGIRINDVSELSLEQTLDCGQCFRWKQNSDGNWCGIVRGIYRELHQEEDSVLIIGANEDEFKNLWYDYFDLGRNYEELKRDFSENEMLKDACGFYPGIRVLRQEPWEAFITFIISQNNNIARIKGIVERLCEAFGEVISEGKYKFPTPERLSSATEEELSKIGCGYRSAYLKNAAAKVFERKLDLEALKTSPLSEARERLLNVLGIGPKVADCVLLYGLGRVERCPADVWMKRVLNALGGEMPECVSNYAGIAQQFLFHYARNFPEKFVEISAK